MNKFTVGPWEIIKDDNGTVDSVRTKNFNSPLMGDYHGCIIADFNNSHGNRPHAYAEALANAQLITAAPEMYEALKYLIIEAQIASDKLQGSSVGLRAWINLSANALAKAEGKTGG